MCGLQHAKHDDEVEAKQPFGIFFTYTELPDLPYVEMTSVAFWLPLKVLRLPLHCVQVLKY